MRLARSELQAPIVRATALELLDRTPRPDGLAALQAALGSGEPLLRRTAAAYWQLRSAQDIERIAPLFSDPVKAVRISVVVPLAQAPRDRLKPYQQQAFDAALAEYRESMTYEFDFTSSSYNLGLLLQQMGTGTKPRSPFVALWRSSPKHSITCTPMPTISSAAAVAPKHCPWPSA